MAPTSAWTPFSQAQTPFTSHGHHDMVFNLGMSSSITTSSTSTTPWHFLEPTRPNLSPLDSPSPHYGNLESPSQTLIPVRPDLEVSRSSPSYTYSPKPYSPKTACGLPYRIATKSAVDSIFANMTEGQPMKRLTEDKLKRNVEDHLSEPLFPNQRHNSELGYLI